MTTCCAWFLCRHSYSTEKHRPVHAIIAVFHKFVFEELDLYYMYYICAAFALH